MLNAQSTPYTSGFLINSHSLMVVQAHARGQYLLLIIQSVLLHTATILNLYNSLDFISSHSTSQSHYFTHTFSSWQITDNYSFTQTLL